MGLYLVLPFIIFFIAPNIRTRLVMGKHDSTGANLAWVLGAFVVTFIWIYGLRDSGGADDMQYRLFYERNYGGSFFQFFDANKEPVFNLLKMLGYSIGANYKMLFLGYTVILLVFLVAGLKKYFESKSELVMYLAGFFFIAFSGVFTAMRQSAAMAMLFYLYSLENPTWKKRICIWLLIICTHYGFIILLPIEIIMALKNYKLATPVKLIVPVLCFILGKIVDLSYIIQKITSSLGMFDYMNQNDNYNSAAGVGIVTMCLFAIYVFQELYINRVQKKSSDKYLYRINEISYAQMMYFSIIFLASDLRWANRLCYYYLFMLPFLVIDLYKLLPSSRNKKLIQLTLIGLLYVGFFVVMKNALGETGYIWSLDFY